MGERQLEDFFLGVEPDLLFLDLQAVFLLDFEGFDLTVDLLFFPGEQFSGVGLCVLQGFICLLLRIRDEFLGGFVAVMLDFGDVVVLAHGHLLRVIASGCMWFPGLFSACV